MTKRNYFGTDGIRGRANVYPMTADVALRVATATARVLKRDGVATRRVVIGKDTRRSCYMLEQAMASGFLSMGMEVVLTGPIPTPAVAMLTRSLRCDIGVMISASHNPYADNGIKIFAADGYKLADDVESQIESWIDHPNLFADMPQPDQVGRASRLDDALGRYVEYVKASVPRGQTLEGLRVVVDCAHGAAYRAAPQTLWELEADVIAIGDNPDGRNINHGCGATHTDLLQRVVVEEKADVGIALDGDADRLIMVDELGRKIDGDQLLGLLATTLKQRDELVDNTVVATVMSNLGLERYLGEQNITLLRAQVGDRYVMEKMKEGGFTLGGEQSGHMILSNYGTTGDGLLAALHILSRLKESGKKASEFLRIFTPVPQVLKNVRFESGAPLQDQSVMAAVQKAEKTLQGQGRILVRASGTEPVIRIMAEGDNQKMVDDVIKDVSSAIEQAARAS
jgi:phosphoglucosamine mutase